MALLFLQAVVLLLFSRAALCFQQYCRCQDGQLLLVNRIDDCAQCTIDWCLSQGKALEDTSPDEIIISCFTNESRKEQVIIYVFVATLVVLACRVLYNRRAGTG